MTQTTVPTIRDTINQLLPPTAQTQYAALINSIVVALVERERRIYGDNYVADNPIESEIRRRLDEDQEAVGYTDTADDVSLAERVTRLEAQVANLVSFARDNGYRL